jgi:DNA-binding MarR family transcriptional regulator
MLTKQQTTTIQQSINKTDDHLPLLFQALGEHRRFQLFCLLIDHPGLCVTEIAKVLGVSVPAASQQLRILGRMNCWEIRLGNPDIDALVAMCQKETSS